jgi:hypothetical protein
MPMGIRLRGWRRCDEGEVAGIAAIELVRVGLEIREVMLSRGREGGLRVSLPAGLPLGTRRGRSRCSGGACRGRQRPLPSRSRQQWQRMPHPVKSAFFPGFLK